MPKTTNQDRVIVREITSADWPVIEQLFGARGACGGCWCMHWRREKGGKAWEEAKGEPNRKAFKKLVQSGQAHGMIAVSGTQPVGWCSFGRRSDFPRLERTKAYLRPEDELSDLTEVWSINCLFLNKEFRSQGLSLKLVEGAIKAIRKRKERLIEAYPVPLTKDGKKLPAPFVFTGPEVIYQRLGFKEVQRVSYSRPLYLLELR
jgi:GNAT superfamily N-acetyltransferase